MNQGKICIDGTSIDTYTREDIHNIFCTVLQDTWLFEGTLRENIIYCKTGVSEETLIEVCKAIGLHYFIMTLPEGNNTMIDENILLSAKQKQLITITREN